jgi:hypothetical protein
MHANASQPSIGSSQHPGIQHQQVTTRSEAAEAPYVLQFAGCVSISCRLVDSVTNLQRCHCAGIQQLFVS